MDNEESILKGRELANIFLRRRFITSIAMNSKCYRFSYSNLLSANFRKALSKSKLVSLTKNIMLK